MREPDSTRKTRTVSVVDAASRSSSRVASAMAVENATFSCVALFRLLPDGVEPDNDLLTVHVLDVFYMASRGRKYIVGTGYGEDRACDSPRRRPSVLHDLFLAKEVAVRHRLKAARAAIFNRVPALQ